MQHNGHKSQPKPKTAAERLSSLNSTRLFDPTSCNEKTLAEKMIAQQASFVNRSSFNFETRRPFSYNLADSTHKLARHFSKFVDDKPLTTFPANLAAATTIASTPLQKSTFSAFSNKKTMEATASAECNEDCESDEVNEKRERVQEKIRLLSRSQQQSPTPSSSSKSNADSLSTNEAIDVDGECVTAAYSAQAPSHDLNAGFCLNATIPQTSSYLSGLPQRLADSHYGSNGCHSSNFSHTYNSSNLLGNPFFALLSNIQPPYAFSIPTTSALNFNPSAMFPCSAAAATSGDNKLSFLSTAAAAAAAAPTNLAYSLGTSSANNNNISASLASAFSCAAQQQPRLSTFSAECQAATATQRQQTSSSPPPCVSQCFSLPNTTQFFPSSSLAIPSSSTMAVPTSLCFPSLPPPPPFHSVPPITPFGPLPTISSNNNASVFPPQHALFRHWPMAAAAAAAAYHQQAHFHHLNSPYEPPKPPYSYIGLIAQAILSTPEKKMMLNEIYSWIQSRYDYFLNRGHGWRNSIRHNLSLNDCFQKAGRAANGKGNYWTINAANLEDFKRGDFRRRRAQRKARRAANLEVDADDDDDDDDGPLQIIHHDLGFGGMLKPFLPYGFNCHPPPLQIHTPPLLVQQVPPPFSASNMGSHSTTALGILQNEAICHQNRLALGSQPPLNYSNLYSNYPAAFPPPVLQEQNRCAVSTNGAALEAARQSADAKTLTEVTARKKKTNGFSIANLLN